MTAARCEPRTRRRPVPVDDVTAQIIALIPRLRRFAYALTGSVAEGDDIVQTACERALARRAQWQPGTHLDRWLFRIARNAWIDLERARRAPPAAHEAARVDELPGTDGRDVAEAELALDEVVRALASLPQEQRLVLVAVCVEGLSYREAAEMLEVPLGTVMSRLARARSRLHALLYGAPAGMTEAGDAQAD